MPCRHRPALRLGFLLLIGLLLPLVPAAAQPGPPPRLPPGVTAHRNLAYVEDGHVRQQLDLYLPASPENKPLPVILWVHGGGWQGGSKDMCLPLRLGWVAQGYAVASIGYRLSDTATFPAQIQDVKAAVRWLRAHAARFNLDPARFAAWGSSAGGHLVALLGTTGGVAEFDVGADSGQSSRVQAVVDYYGPSDFARFAGTPGYTSHDRTDSPESRLIGGAVTEHPAKAAAASPVTYVTPDDSPFLILHGTADPTVPASQSEALHTALTKAGVPSSLHLLPGARHGGPEFTDAGALKLVGDFLSRTLLSQR